MANLNTPFDIDQLTQRIKRILDGGDPTKDSKINYNEVKLAVKSAIGQLNVGNTDYKSNLEKDTLILNKQKNDLDRLNLIVARQKAKIDQLKQGTEEEGKFLVVFNNEEVQYDFFTQRNYIQIPIAKQIFNKLSIENGNAARQIYYSNYRDILYVGDPVYQQRPFVPKPMGSVIKRHPAYQIDDPAYYIIEQDILWFEKKIEDKYLMMKIRVSSMIDLSSTPAIDDLDYSSLEDLDIIPEKYEKLLIDMVMPMFNRATPDIIADDLPNTVKK
jgi:hypothetical protein